MNANTTTPYRNIYGTHETNGLENGPEYHKTERVDVDWTDKRLKTITRLRIVSDPGFPVWDVTYCHGELQDGTPCAVQLPFSQLPKKNLTGFIIEAAKKDGVFAKGLGILDNISKLC